MVLSLAAHLQVSWLVFAYFLELVSYFWALWVNDL